MQYQLQGLTAKELAYITDSMTNEDLLMKQNATAASTSQHPVFQQLCLDHINLHHQHYHALKSALQQHVQLAPTQPQQ
ncbi:hypothetical protein [Paenibacillus sp. N3.4]|uniref:hypothetical protein n=1 Tax=Paenibacillus sp. N3.4 TaxID=2603222 RepID=UPI0011C92D09|nr:hypothetical protein [Paenibacillus sp. N3.4]TXK83507.1 hypothetical protein FU659_14085 [Paenibacillus sp. N3.4]